MDLFGTTVDAATEMERMAALALKLARRRVAPYASRFSRKDFTQPQLLACVLLRAAFGLTYRGLGDRLAASPAIRDALGLPRTPHFTTIEGCANAPGMDAVIQDILTELVRVAATPDDDEVAMDSTGLGVTVASVYYDDVRREKAERAARNTLEKRADRDHEAARRQREKRYNAPFVKLSVAVLCGSMLPVAVVASMGRSNDNVQSYQVVAELAARAKVRTLYADTGYDSESLHEWCRERHGIESIIPPVPKTKDGRIKTPYRALMQNLPRRYTRRKRIETFFSALKRTTMPAVRALRPDRQMTEAALRVLAYGIRR